MRRGITNQKRSEIIEVYLGGYTRDEIVKTANVSADFIEKSDNISVEYCPISPNF